VANPAQSVINLTLAVTDQLTPAIASIGKSITGLVSQVGTLSTGFLNLSASVGAFIFDALASVGSLPKVFNDLISSLENATPLLNDFAQELEDIGQYSTEETLSGLGRALSQGLSLALPAFRQVSGSVNALAGQVGEKLYPAFTLIDQGILKIVRGAESLSKKSIDLSGHLSDIFAIPSGAREPLIVFDALRNSIGKVSGTLFNVVQEFGTFGLGLNALKQLVQTGPFVALIGQNEELRQQLLATQATLAGTSRVFTGGEEVTDPTKAIQALAGPVKSAIADLRKGSLDLVGVTSKDLVPVFQIVAGQVTQIGGGLDQATALSLDFAAALGTLGIPLFQANQEIRSILTGTVDQNSILAQSLNLNNQQLLKWKEQGTLIDNVRDRLSAFRAGNVLAAQSISGITSNIQEIFDEITRVAGEPLLGSIVEELNSVYQGLKDNSKAYSDYIGGLAADALSAVQSLLEAVKTLIGSVGTAFSKIPVYLFQTLKNGAASFADALKNALVFLQPFINIFAEVAGAAVSASGPFFTLFLQFKLLQGGIKLISGSLGTLFQIIPGLGEVLFVLQGRTSGVLGTFLGLQKGLGPMGAILLVLGQRLGSLGPLAAGLSRSFPLIGGALAKNIPLFANLGVAIAGAAGKSPILNEFLQRMAQVLGALTGQSVAGSGGVSLFGRSLGALIAVLARVAGSAGLPLLSKELSVLSGELLKGTVVTSLFKSSVGSLKSSILGFLTGTVATTAALALAAIAFDKFILKNERLKAALAGFGSFLKDISGSIYNFLTNPLTLATIAATGLAFAIQAKLIPAILELLTIKLSGFLLSAAFALEGFSTALAGVQLAGMSASAAQAAGGIAAMSASLTGGTAALGAFTSGLGATALGIAGVLAPLAVLAAGVGAIGLIRYTKDLKESTEAFEIYRQQSNATADNALEIASKLKKAGDRTAEAQKSGIALSAQEIEANRKLSVSGKLRLADLDDQIKLLQAAQKEAVGDEIRNAFGSQIAMLEATRKALDKYIGNVQIAARVLPQLGDAFTQIADKAAAAQKAIANPVGDVEVFKKKIEEYQQVTEQQIAIGAISLAEAESRYRKIASLSTLEAEAQVKAAQSAVQARKEQIKQETDLSAALVEQRKAAIASGSVDEYKGYAQVFKLQRESLLNQKGNIENLISLESQAGRGRGKIAKELFLEKQGFETQLTTLAAEELNKRIELESRYLANAQAEVSDAIAQSEQAVLLETQQAYNAQQITQTQAEQARVDTTRQRLNLELELAKNHVADLEAIERSKSPEKAEEQERTLRTARLKTAQLVTQIAEQQQRDQEALTKSIQERIALEQRAIENLAERQTQAYERQLELLGKLNSALELQNKLIDSRKTLQGAIGDYLQTEYKILISTAKTDEEKQKLTQRAAEIEIKFLQERQRLDRESLEIKLRLQRLEDERSRIQNQSDQITAASNIKGAQAKLAEAEANPQSTKEELDALRLGVEAATSKLGAEQTKGDLLGTTAQVNREQENVQRRTLLLNQGGEYDQKRLDYAQTLAPEKQEKFIENLRKEITNRLKTNGDYSLTRRDQEKQSVYTPTTYNTLGRFNPETGEIEQNPYPTPKDHGKSLSGQVKSMELPKDILSGLPGLTKAQSDTTDVLKRLEEKVLLSPILTELQRANNFAAGLSEHIGTLILRESKPAGTTNNYNINGRGKVLRGANI
jgi:hypothetical protein